MLSLAITAFVDAAPAGERGPLGEGGHAWTLPPTPRGGWGRGRGLTALSVFYLSVPQRALLL